jgi:hypothetical protein
MTWMFTEAGTRTKVEMTYVVGGYMRGGVQQVVKIVDQVLGGQVQRLKRYVESGPLRSEPNSARSICRFGLSCARRVPAARSARALQYSDAH